MIILLLLLVTVAAGLRIIHWRRTSRLFSFTAVAATFAIGCGIVPTIMLKHLQAAYVSDVPIDWADKNVIVILGAGTERLPNSTTVEPSVFAYARLNKTEELYRDCKVRASVCTILISGGDAQKNGASEAASYSADLVRLGIPLSDIVLEVQSLNTWQNVKYSSAILKALDANRIVLVSSAIHLRRSDLYFSHFGIHAVLVPADYVSAIPSLLPLAYNFMLTDFALHEYLGLARYRIYTLLGWNELALHQQSSPTKPNLNPNN